MIAYIISEIRDLIAFCSEVISNVEYWFEGLSVLIQSLPWFITLPFTIVFVVLVLKLVIGRD